MSEIVTNIEVVYSQIGGWGYEEDTWEMTGVIASSEDLIRFMKRCYNKDAHNRTQYPLNGSVDGRFYFYKRTYQKCDMGHYHLISEESVDCDWYRFAWMQFCEWLRDFKVRVSAHFERVARYEKKKRDLELLEKLKRKYECEDV